MKKAILAVIICLAVLFAYDRYTHLWLPVQADMHVVVSSDSTVCPGKKLEFLITVLEKTESGIAGVNAPCLKAEISDKNPDYFKRISLRAHLKPTGQRGMYSAVFNIPADFYGKKASFTVWHDIFGGRRIFSDELSVKQNYALVVQPPQSRVYCGSWLQIKTAVLDPLSGEGICGAPVNVKMTSSRGHQTVNRVFPVSSDGTGVFSTYIHSAAKEGTHVCTFSFASETVEIAVNVEGIEAKKKNLKKNLQKESGSLITSILDHSAFQTSPQHYNYKQKAVRSNACLRIQDVKMSCTGADKPFFLYYECPGSSYRQIELWQNRKLCYASELLPEASHIQYQLPFNHRLASGIPVQIKLWYILNSSIREYHQTLIPDGDTPSETFLGQQNRLYKELYSLQRIDEQRDGELLVNNYKAGLMDKFLDHTGELKNNRSPQYKTVFSPRKGYIEIFPAFDRRSFAPIFNDPERFLQPIDPSLENKRRFFLVENELQISKFTFSDIRIWRSKRKFLSSLSELLAIDHPNIDYLVGEAECGLMLIEGANEAERSRLLERLEGLLAPLCEFYDYCLTVPELKTAWQERILRIFAGLRKNLEIPSKYVADAASFADSKLVLGPILPIMPFSVDDDHLDESMSRIAKANLISQKGSMMINLDRDLNILGKKTLSTKTQIFQKLLNPHSVPFIAEIVF